MKLYRPTLLAFTISLGTIHAGSASAEPRSTSSYITFDDQNSAAVQAATDYKRSLEDQMTNRENRIVTTRHQVDVAGRVLKYTARAGRLPILDNETGQVHAMMFFTSYTLDSPPGKEKLRQPQRPRQRPLMFLWNGGPGSSSSLVHLLGFGPRRLQPDGKSPSRIGVEPKHHDEVLRRRTYDVRNEGGPRTIEAGH